MKYPLFVASALSLLLTACASNSQLAQQSQPVLAGDNAQLCENHKGDYQYFRAAFDKEHGEVCANGCQYTPAMTKNSDTMERIAGLYYLMDCDYRYGRL